MEKTFQLDPSNRYDWASLKNHLCERAIAYFDDDEPLELMPMIYYGNIFAGYNYPIFSEKGALWLDFLKMEDLPEMQEVPLEDIPEDLLIDARDTFDEEFLCVRVNVNGSDVFIVCEVDDWMDVFFSDSSTQLMEI